MSEAPSNPSAAEPEKVSILKEWVLPIVLGLAFGVGILFMWPGLATRIASVFRSDTDRLVAAWDPFNEDPEYVDKLEKQIRDLGREAREDLLATYRKVTPAGPEDIDGDAHKLWVAQLLARDPFNDTRSLVDILKDKSAAKWDRRIAAAALFDVLGKDADPELVCDPLLEWLEDETVVQHGIPSQRLKQMRSLGVLPPDRDARLVAALVKIAATPTKVKSAEEIVQHIAASDRQSTIHQLGTIVAKDAEVKKLMWKIALDEKESVNARVAAVRSLSENDQFKEEDIDLWKRAAKAEHDVVRQCVAENLFRSPDPAFNETLAALHRDRNSLVRAGSIDAQNRRSQPTMLGRELYEELLEDASPSVRWQALLSAGRFKDNVADLTRRQGQILRHLETSDLEEDIMGAILALRMMTNQTFGFAESDVDVPRMDVSESAVAAFIADKEGRATAIKRWRETLSGSAIFTDADQKAVLERLRKHPDPENVKHAEIALGLRAPDPAPKDGGGAQDDGEEK